LKAQYGLFVLKVLLNPNPSVNVFVITLFVIIVKQMLGVQDNNLNERVGINITSGTL